MTRKEPPPKRTIVVSNNRPKIQIVSNGDDLLRLTVPGVNRQSLALAHAIVCGFLCDITDEQNHEMLHEPRIAPGDRLLTCLVITIELARPNVHQSHTPTRFKLKVLRAVLHEAARRVCTPLYGGQPEYDVVEAS